MRLEIGKYNNLPHYSVIGTPNNFYIWKNEDGHGRASKWIKGEEAFGNWHKLNNYVKKDKVEFIKLLSVLYSENTKETIE